MSKTQVVVEADISMGSIRISPCQEGVFERRSSCDIKDRQGRFYLSCRAEGPGDRECIPVSPPLFKYAVRVIVSSITQEWC